MPISVTFDRDPISHEPTVEVAHEAILRHWQQLRLWLDESRSDIRQQRLLAGSTAEWISAKRDSGYLLGGSRLAQFEGWAVSTSITLTPDERAFLNASTAQEQRRRLLRRRIRNAALAISVSIALLMAILALIALDRERRAAREAAVNRSLVLASAALKDAETYGSGYALPLALEAVSIENPPKEAVSTLEQLTRGSATRAILRQTGNPVNYHP